MITRIVALREFHGSNQKYMNVGLALEHNILRWDTPVVHSGTGHEWTLCTMDTSHRKLLATLKELIMGLACARERNRTQKWRTCCRGVNDKFRWLKHLTYISEKYETKMIATKSAVVSDKIANVSIKLLIVSEGQYLLLKTAFENKSTCVNPNYPNHAKSISSRLNQSQCKDQNGTPK